MPLVTFHIRKAKKEDFFDSNNKPLYGTMYFLEKTTGDFDKAAYYFTENTDKKSFKEWFKNKQVYVFSKFYENLSFNP